MKGTASQPIATTRACMASAARSGEDAEASAMEARRGRDAIGDSMRSTRARSGIAGDAQNLGSVETHLLKHVDPHIRLHAFPQIRRSTQPRNRLCDEARKRKAVCAYFRNSARTRRRAIQQAQTRDGPRTIAGPRIQWRKKAPRRRAGRRATISRPCCATRSGCARRPRLRPGGRRWSPGTTGHPASPTGKADPPC